MKKRKELQGVFGLTKVWCTWVTHGVVQEIVVVSASMLSCTWWSWSVSSLIFSNIERSLKQPATLESLLSSREVGEYVKQEKDLITIDSETVISDVLKVSQRIPTPPFYIAAQHAIMPIADLNRKQNSFSSCFWLQRAVLHWVCYGDMLAYADPYRFVNLLDIVVWVMETFPESMWLVLFAHKLIGN